jgi:hypothetical protein
VSRHYSPSRCGNTRSNTTVRIPRSSRRNFNRETVFYTAKSKRLSLPRKEVCFAWCGFQNLYTTNNQTALSIPRKKIYIVWCGVQNLYTADTQTAVSIPRKRIYFAWCGFQNICWILWPLTVMPGRWVIFHGPTNAITPSDWQLTHNCHLTKAQTEESLEMKTVFFCIEQTMRCLFSFVNCLALLPK